MKILAFLLGGVTLCLANHSNAQSVMPTPPLAPAALAEMRGGFDLPNGAVITLGVTTATSVDGREVLRTTFDIQGGAAQLRVAATPRGDSAAGAIDLQAARSGVETLDGVVTVRTDDHGTRVELAGDRIDVSHLTGQAFGSVIANSASDRSINVATTVDIGLTGITPDAIGGSLARVNDLALDATSRMNP